MDEEEVELDIYFQGGKQQLYAFLYPLTGPNCSIFDHLDLTAIRFDQKNRKFDFLHSTKNFTNLQKEDNIVVYKSTALASHSNYFYSMAIPEKNALVWRSINRMVQLRPGPKEQAASKSESMEEQYTELTYIQSQDPNSKVIVEMLEVPGERLAPNWHISKEQYITRLYQ